MGGRTGLGLTHETVKEGLIVAVDAVLDLGDSAAADEFLGIVRDARPGEVTPYLRAHAARLAARLAALRKEHDTESRDSWPPNRGSGSSRSPSI